METTLLNKLILIFVIFLIGLSIIDGFTILTPKIIEGNTNDAIGYEATVHKHTGQIALLKEELDIVSELKKDINKTNVDLVATNKIVDEHQESINKLTEASMAAASADSLEPSKQ
jgi:intein/homing endonuclease